MRVLAMVGALVGFGTAALHSVAGAARRVQAGRPPDRRELALTSGRMSRLGRAVESIAVEVERVGGGQRFVTKLLAGGRALGGADRAAQPTR